MDAKVLIGTICYHFRSNLTYEIKTEGCANRLLEFVRVNTIAKATRERKRILSDVEEFGYKLPKSTEVIGIYFKWFNVYLIPPIIGDRPKYTLQDLYNLKNDKNISK